MIKRIKKLTAIGQPFSLTAHFLISGTFATAALSAMILIPYFSMFRW
jgi:hypothetical protein